MEGDLEKNETLQMTSQISLCTKFHSNGTMGKDSKIGGKLVIYSYWSLLIKFPVEAYSISGHINLIWSIVINQI